MSETLITLIPVIICLRSSIVCDEGFYPFVHTPLTLKKMKYLQSQGHDFTIFADCVRGLSLTITVGLLKFPFCNIIKDLLREIVNVS